MDGDWNLHGERWECNVKMSMLEDFAQFMEEVSWECVSVDLDGFVCFYLRAKCKWYWNR